MSIQITSQRAILDWNTHNAKVNISGNGAAHILKMSTTKPVVNLKTEKPQIQIDQSQCFAEAGLMSIPDLIADNAAYAQEKVSEGIARIVDQGNELAAIETGYDPIPDQAYSNAYDLFVHEFVYTTIPKSRPQIDFTRGTVDVQFQEGKVNNETQLKKLEVSYTPGKVERFMKQYQSISISFTGNALDVKA
ncbi:DUF6470 family protein [Fusibacter sp. 3D3]|uniref:DUF6470 family protein n=1 Tax=Fusibacter sp. 3D3 TaxID=1048380 RepID=UPI000857EB36|nr:DUF6470 family protein [Fusibacter sp. 3D3]GAU75667.1 hypothetical protein F3D3_0258 [Fusibacter sp. 3D3]